MAKMIPVIMNSSFVRLAVIEDYISFIWTERYYDCGDFELCVAASVNYMTLFKKDYYVVRDDSENVGIIEDIRIQRNENGFDMLIVSGRFLSSILGRRIIATQTTVNGTISNCVNQLILQNVIEPSDASRTISNFTVGSYSITDAIKAQYTGKNLLETISDICRTYKVGFKVTLNEDHEFVFTMYKGKDRTYNQTTNTYVIFSDEYDNLLSSEYEENYQNIATAVLVAGEGEGLDRKTKWVTDGSTGLARHEVYKDQRQLQSNDGEITAEEYNELLEEAGEESLTQYTTTFSGEVYFDNVVYKQDVDLGDLCVIENSRWGIHLYSRLVEVIESTSETGEYSIVPTFGV